MSKKRSTIRWFSYIQGTRSNKEDFHRDDWLGLVQSAEAEREYRVRDLFLEQWENRLNDLKALKSVWLGVKKYSAIFADRISFFYDDDCPGASFVFLLGRLVLVGLHPHPAGTYSRAKSICVVTAFETNIYFQYTCNARWSIVLSTSRGCKNDIWWKVWKTHCLETRICFIALLWLCGNAAVTSTITSLIRSVTLEQRYWSTYPGAPAVVFLTPVLRYHWPFPHNSASNCLSRPCLYCKAGWSRNTHAVPVVYC